MRPFFLLVCLVFTAAGAARAHESPATAIYLDYTLQDEAILAVIEGGIQHFGPLVDAVPDPTAPPEDTTPLHSAFLDFLQENCPVTADGVPLVPEIQAFSFAPINDEILPGRFIDIVLALTEIRYPLPPDLQPPSQITIAWNALPKLPEGFALADFEETGHISLDEAVMSYRAGDGPPDFYAFTRSTTTFNWQLAAISPGLASTTQEDTGPDLALLQIEHYVPLRELPLPVLSITLGAVAALALFWLPGRPALKFRWRIAVVLLAVGFFLRHESTWAIELPEGRVADTLDDDTGTALFTALLRNIYTAFDYESEDEIYDALSQSVSGALLDRIYTEVYQSLLMEEADGAAATVQRVDVLETSLSPSEIGDSILVTAHWTVEGVVAHNKHVHLRVNEYSARYTMAPVEGLWKFTDVEQISADRILANETPAPADDSLFPQ